MSKQELLNLPLDYYYQDFVYPKDGMVQPVLSNVAYPESETEFGLSQHPQDFVSRVEAWNADQIRWIMGVLNDCLSDVHKEHLAVMLIGSDGKREKGPYSPFQFLILTTNQDLGEYARKKILARSSAHIDRRQGCLTRMLSEVDPNLEIKFLSPDPTVQQSITGYKGDPNHSWPDQILSAQLVFGSPHLVSWAHAIIYDEYHSNSSVRKSVKNARRKYVQTVETGFSDNGRTQHFDLERGILCFTDNNYVKGLKYGPLRLIQTYLVIFQLEHQLLDLDHHIPARISQLFSNHDEHPAVINAYDEALRLYHLQQWYYAQERKTDAQIRLDTDFLASILINSLLINALTGQNS